MPFGARVRRLFSSVSRLFTRASRPAPVPKAAAAPYVMRIVSDAVQLNEIPSPTEREEKRLEFILGRLTDFGYTDPFTDEWGNAAVVIPGISDSREHVLLFSDIGCDAYSPTESLCRLSEGQVRGRGIAENSTGAAALLSVAEYAAKNGVRFGSSVVLLFTAFDPGGRDVQPLERFLGTWKGEFRFAAYVRGIPLGRDEVLPMGTYKLSVTARTPPREIRPGDAAPSAISVLAAIAYRLGAVKWDSTNSTFLNIARIEAGAGFGWPAEQGVLELEIFSTDRSALELARGAVRATIDDISAQMDAAVDVAVKAYFPASDPAATESLAAVLRGVQDRLKIKRVPTSIPDHSAFVKSLSIPALSIGVTTGGKSWSEEYIDIPPLETGFRQILLFLEESCEGGAEPAASAARGKGP